MIDTGGEVILVDTGKPAETPDGEPFFRADIKEILTYLGEHRQEVSYGILSNGSFLDAELVALLKETAVSFIQLSIDGDSDTHDDLRAKGDYVRVFRTAQSLERAGIRTYVSFTANKSNYTCLPKVAHECRKRGITKLWSDRLVPIGSGENLTSLAITDADLPKYLHALRQAQGTPIARWFSPKTQITMNRALQFIGSDGDVYSCSAGSSLITVDEFGRIMPCRRMPIICGDVFTSTLSDIYFHHPTFVDLRRNYIPKECAACRYRFPCREGARCQSYAQYHTYRRADPACPLKQE